MLKIYRWSGEFLFYLARDCLLVKSSAKWILGVGSPAVFFKCDDCTNWNLNVSFKLYREGKAKGEFYICWGLSGSKKNKPRLAKGKFFVRKKKREFQLWEILSSHLYASPSPTIPPFSCVVNSGKSCRVTTKKKNTTLSKIHEDLHIRRHACVRTTNIYFLFFNVETIEQPTIALWWRT